MSTKWILLKALVTLVVIGLLIVGGFAIYRTGWSQGYVAGQLAAEGEEGAAVPYLPRGFGYPRPHFGFAPFLVGAGLLFLLLITIGKLFRFWTWKKWAMAGGPWAMAGGPMGGHWARHWHRPHGPMPPWCWGWEKPSEGETKKTEAEPDTETGAAEA